MGFEFALYSNPMAVDQLLPLSASETEQLLRSEHLLFSFNSLPQAVFCNYNFFKFYTNYDSLYIFNLTVCLFNFLLPPSDSKLLLFTTANPTNYLSVLEKWNLSTTEKFFPVLKSTKTMNSLR